MGIGAWVAASAVASGAMPPEIDLDDPAPWEAVSEALLDGPPGCWEATGSARWDHDLGRWGRTRGSTVFAARLVDGVWGDVLLYPTGEEVERGGETATVREAEARFVPLVGRVRGLQVSLDRERELHVRRSDDPRVTAVSTVRDVVSRLSDGVETSFLAWDDDRDALVLERTTAAGRRSAAVTARAWFHRGAPLPTAYDLDLLGTYVHSGVLPARVDRLVAQLRGRVEEGVVLPVAEAMRFRLRMPLVEVQAAQTIEYASVVRCPSPRDGTG